MAEQLDEPNADQILMRTYNMGMSKTEIVPLALDKTYVVCLLRLGPAVQLSDYPALEAAINGIPGVVDTQFLIHHHTRDAIPNNTQLRACIECKLRIDPQ